MFKWRCERVAWPGMCQKFRALLRWETSKMSTETESVREAGECYCVRVIVWLEKLSISIDSQ